MTEQSMEQRRRRRVQFSPQEEVIVDNDSTHRPDECFFSRQELNEIRGKLRFRLLHQQHNGSVSVIPESDDSDDENDGLEAFADFQRCERRRLAAHTILRCDRKLRNLQAQLAGTDHEDISLLLAKVAHRIAQTERRAAMERGLVQFCSVYPERVMERFPKSWQQYTQIVQRRQQHPNAAPHPSRAPPARLSIVGRSELRLRPQIPSKPVSSSNNAAQGRNTKRHVNHDGNNGAFPSKRKCIRSATEHQHHQQ